MILDKFLHDLHDVYEHQIHNYHLIGILLGVVAVTCFAMTLPMTRYLFLLDLTVWDVALGRSLLGALFALVLLIVTRQKLPQKKYLLKLFFVGIAAAFGFNLLITYGTYSVPASNGGVILAANGISAALFARIFSSERPSLRFWVTSLAGFLLIILFSYLSHGGVNILNVYFGELALLGAVLMAGISHALGGVLAKEMGSWQVICWAMVMTLPILIPLSFILIDFASIEYLSFWGWFHMLFLGVVNSCFVFFMWYHAMLLGGISKTTQLQLSKPFITFLVAVIWLGEPFDPLVITFMVLMVLVIFVSQRTHVAESRK